MTIVVVDDDSIFLKAIQETLKKQYAVETFPCPIQAEKWLEKQEQAIILFDLNYPNVDGLEILKKWKTHHRQWEIVVCSGETKVKRAVEALRLGASDFIVKPFCEDDLHWILRRLIDKQQRALHQQPHTKPLSNRFFIAESPSMKKLLQEVQTLRHETQLNALIIGESGTGKEEIARLLYEQENSPRRPFVVVNMAAIPAPLLEAELFGVEKGAYTDAKASRPGKFELADGGDIFLDEIGDLPTEAQAKLLRVLQQQEVERLGSGRNRQVHFRVISATNRSLANLIQQGAFREDLLYRLNDVVLWVPPLRERPEDIPKLTEYFVRRFSKEGTPPTLTPTALETLVNYPWPGNVRQMESVIKRAMVFNTQTKIDHIEIQDIGNYFPSPVAGSMIHESLAKKYETHLATYERRLIESALQRHHGDKKAAMGELGLPRATFYRKLQEFRIES